MTFLIVLTRRDIYAALTRVPVEYGTRAASEKATSTVAADPRSRDHTFTAYSFFPQCEMLHQVIFHSTVLLIEILEQIGDFFVPPFLFFGIKKPRFLRKYRKCGPCQGPGDFQARETEARQGKDAPVKVASE